MRKFGLGVATLLVAVAPASAEVFRTKVKESGVVTTFHSISDDGCVETTGELAAVKTNDGTQAIVSAHRADYCAGADWFYLDGGPVTLSMHGLVSASLSGTLELVPYSGPDNTSLTLELDLTFQGTGPVNKQKDRYVSEGDGSTTVSFTRTRMREATASGSFTADGAAATMTSAQLAKVTSGELVIVH